MPLTREQKQVFIKDLKEKLRQQKVTFFINFSGLKAKDLFRLRQKLKKNDAIFWVGKKTLVKIALKGQGLPAVIDKFGGQLALILGFEDEIRPAKILYQFQQEHQAPEILGGLSNNEWVEKEKIIEWATLLGREELLAKLIGQLTVPVAKFENILAANLKSLLYLLTAKHTT